MRNNPRNWFEKLLHPDRRIIIYWYILTLLLLACLVYVRRPEALNNPQFWAEDGGLLFQDNQDLGLSAIFLPKGYLLVAQRLLAAVAGFWGAALAPLIYHLFALFSTLLVGLYILRSRVGISIAGKSLMVLSLALIPHSGEVFLNLCGVQIFTACLLVILALQGEPVRQRDIVIDLLLLVLAGLSGPYILIISPLFVFRCFYAGWTKHNIRLLAVVVGLVTVQGTIFATSFRMATTEAPWSSSISDWWTTIGIVIPGHLWLGWLSDFAPHDTFMVFYDRLVMTPHKSVTNLVPPSAFLVLTPVILLVLVYITKTSGRRFPIYICFAATVLFFGASLIDNKDDPTRIFIFWGIGRYFYHPYLCATWALIFRVSEKTIGPWSPAKLAASVLLVLTIISASSNFVWPALPDLHWREYVEMRNPSEETVIPTNPRPWRVVLKPE